MSYSILCAAAPGYILVSLATRDSLNDVLPPARRTLRQPSTVHTCGFSPECVRECEASAISVLNVLKHSASPHANGRSAECVIMCFLRMASAWKRLPHMSHTNLTGGSPPQRATRAGVYFRMLPRDESTSFDWCWVRRETRRNKLAAWEFRVRGLEF